MLVPKPDPTISLFIIDFLRILLKHLLAKIRAKAQQTRDVQSTTSKKNLRIKTKILRSKDAKTRIAC